MTDYDDLTVPVVAGQSAADRLMDTLHRDHDGRHLTRAEVAAVVRALADFTAIKAAVHWVPTTSSPAVSVCRWLHDTADELDKEATS